MAQIIAHKLDDKPRTEDISINENYTFKSLLLQNTILQGLTDAGFHIPSPIQLKAIPLGKCGLDLIVQAKSGTGKTAVFSIIALEMLKPEQAQVQILILAPTREIAVQIEDVIKTIGKHVQGLKVGCFIGGLPIENDIENLKNCNIVVGAPGRIKHLIQDGHLKTDSVKLFILDEADKLMEQSFQNNINFIYYKLPVRKQMIALSATYPNVLKDFLENYMQLPTFVTPRIEVPILLGLRQFVTVIKSNVNVMQKMKTKVSELVRLFSKISFTQCLVFCNYQTQAESVSNFLNSKGWETLYISGAQSQQERLKAFNSLKKFQCRILLSTDLTSRGIDAANVDLVINYDVPYEAENYLHRMGRAGRYGAEGLCITIVSDDKEMKSLQNVLGMIGGTELSIAQLPEGENLVDDIWKCDLNKFPSIYGIVNSEKQVGKNELSRSVLEIKNSKKNNAEIVSSEMEKLSVIESTSSTSKVEVNKCDQNPGSNLCEASLKREVAATANMSSKNNQNEFNTATAPRENLLVEGEVAIETNVNSSTNDLISPASLYPWVPVEQPIFDNSESQGFSLLEENSNGPDHNTKCKKRKRNLPSAAKSASSTNKDESSILAKNVGLYNVSKLLTGDSSEFDKAVQSTSYLLQNMKQLERSREAEISSQFESQSCSDLLKNLEFFMNESNEKVEHVEPNVDPLTNIFELGYNSICKGGTHWIDALGDKYEPPKKEEVSEMEPYDFELDEIEDETEMDDSNQYDFGYVTNESRYKKYRGFRTNRCNTRTNRSRYNNVISNQRLETFDQGAEGASLENYYHDRFEKYYDSCIDNFVSKTSNEDVNFDQYFMQWQHNMRSVRDFVQQNIYMDIMNYQYQNQYQN